MNRKSKLGVPVGNLKSINVFQEIEHSNLIYYVLYYKIEINERLLKSALKICNYADQKQSTLERRCIISMTFIMRSNMWTAIRNFNTLSRHAG